MIESRHPILADIHDELRRLNAEPLRVEIDEQFEPRVGPLAHVQYGDAYWHLFPAQLLELLEELPDGTGPEIIQRSIEQKADWLWHGPSPRGSRDTSSEP
jgi:hypothetical protein